MKIVHLNGHPSFPVEYGNYVLHSSHNVAVIIIPLALLTYS